LRAEIASLGQQLAEAQELLERAAVVEAELRAEQVPATSPRKANKMVAQELARLQGEAAEAAERGRILEAECQGLREEHGEAETLQARVRELETEVREEAEKAETARRGPSIAEEELRDLTQDLKQDQQDLKQDLKAPVGGAALPDAGLAALVASQREELAALELQMDRLREENKQSGPLQEEEIACRQKQGEGPRPGLEGEMAEVMAEVEALRGELEVARGALAETRIRLEVPPSPL
jgi:DNA repair exonuclease SbcCD ATPase subunit